MEDAHKELSLRYGTRSLDYCIEKYGKYEGVIKFNERNKKWIDTLNTKSDEEKLEILKRKTRNLKRYSKKSINLFQSVFEYLNTICISFEKIYMAENEFFIYDQSCKRINFYDLMIKQINLIVEYNGIAFHPNKQKLSDEEWKTWKNIYTKKTADEQYEVDTYKRDLALSKKFEYLVIWENDNIEESKQKIINKIIELYECRNN